MGGQGGNITFFRVYFWQQLTLYSQLNEAGLSLLKVVQLRQTETVPRRNPIEVHGAFTLYFVTFTVNFKSPLSEMNAALPLPPHS